MKSPSRLAGVGSAIAALTSGVRAGVGNPHGTHVAIANSNELNGHGHLETASIRQRHSEPLA